MKNLKKFFGKVVRINYIEDFSKIQKEVICLLLNDEKNNYIIFSHPFDLKEKFMFCGESYMPKGKENISDISPITNEEFENWKKEYFIFTDLVKQEKGYDVCEIPDIEEIEYYG